MLKYITLFFTWVGNFFKPSYETVWAEDLPKRLAKRKIYIVGGREHPFQVVFLCPKSCGKIITINISQQHKKNERWQFYEHKNGSISLYPSLHMKTLDCDCHYWFKKGRIVWTKL